MNEELDIFNYKPNATAAQDYRNLVEEYLKEEWDNEYRQSIIEESKIWGKGKLFK